MDRGAWRAVVHGVAKSRLSNWTELSFQLTLETFVLPPAPSRHQSWHHVHIMATVWPGTFVSSTACVDAVGRGNISGGHSQ